jgi:hypothetical protein
VTRLQTISRAKQAVFDFSKEVVTWVERQITAFREGEARRFSVKTWNNLEPVRYEDYLSH